MPTQTTPETNDHSACAPIGWTAAVNTFNDARRFQKDLRPGTWLAMSSAARHYNASQRKRQDQIEFVDQIAAACRHFELPWQTEFREWVTALLEEKGLSTHDIVAISGPTAECWFELAFLIRLVEETPPSRQTEAQDILISLDMRRKPILDYFAGLARALAN